MSFDLIPELATELAATDLPESTEPAAAPGAEFAPWACRPSW